MHNGAQTMDVVLSGKVDKAVSLLDSYDISHLHHYKVLRNFDIVWPSTRHFLFKIIIEIQM